MFVTRSHKKKKGDSSPNKPRMLYPLTGHLRVTSYYFGTSTQTTQMEYSVLAALPPAVSWDEME